MFHNVIFKKILMVLQNNTIFITGGSSGIGLELAKSLLKKKNKVIICGRSADKLEVVKKLYPEIIIFQCDISQDSECKRLLSWIKKEHPSCNILVNNAAIVHTTNFYEDENILLKAGAEIQTNLTAPLTLIKFFLPVIEKNQNPKIINITTGLVYAPKATYPIYNATKAALHSFTQGLRVQMKNVPISIIEVLFPAVDTPWHKGNAPGFAITPEVAVKEMIEKIEKGQKEIKIGKVKILYLLSRIAPSFALKMMNKSNT